MAPGTGPTLLGLDVKEASMPMSDCMDWSYMVNVYDILGNLVFNDKNTVEGESKTIDLSQLAKGIYQVQVANNGVTKNSKLVIQ